MCKTEFLFWGRDAGVRWGQEAKRQPGHGHERGPRDLEFYPEGHRNTKGFSWRTECLVLASPCSWHADVGRKEAWAKMVEADKVEGSGVIKGGRSIRL